MGWLGKDTRVLKVENRKVLLVVLPFWIYLKEDFLFNFSEKIGNVSEREIPKIIEYIEKKKIPETIQGEYIRTVMKRLSPFNTYSLLAFLDKSEF